MRLLHLLKPENRRLQIIRSQTLSIEIEQKNQDLIIIVALLRNQP